MCWQCRVAIYLRIHFYYPLLYKNHCMAVYSSPPRFCQDILHNIYSAFTVQAWTLTSSKWIHLLLRNKNKWRQGFTIPFRNISSHLKNKYMLTRQTLPEMDNNIIFSQQAFNFPSRFCFRISDYLVELREQKYLGKSKLEKNVSVTILPTHFLRKIYIHKENMLSMLLWSNCMLKNIGFKGSTSCLQKGKHWTSRKTKRLNHIIYSLLFIIIVKIAFSIFVTSTFWQSFVSYRL